jgi:hypothetical protein
VKQFLLLISSLTFAGTAHAQAGLRAGGSLSGYRHDTNNNFHTSTDARLGYQVGVFYQLPLTKRLSLVPEVQYSDERTTVTKTNDVTFEGGYSSTFRSRLSYLSVPILLRATFGPVYVEAGVQGSRLLGGHENGSVTSGGVVGPTTYGIDREVTYRYRRYDVGPSAGIGVKLPAGLGVSVRAYQGLVSLSHDGEANYGHLYRQSLQASLTYQLPGR